MSISISIGYNNQDLDKIQKTITYLYELKNITKDIQPNDSQIKSLNHNDDITNLIQWYEDILRILYNGGSPEDFNTNLDD
jgi:hypothetical protein